MRRRIVGLALCGLAGVACGHDPEAPSLGTLLVEVTVVGLGSDPDGFGLTLDGATAGRIAPSSSPAFLDVSPGPHEIALGDISPSCALQGQEVREATVSPGDTSTVGFEIDCEETAGEVQVTVRSAGTDIDPNGYLLLLDSTPRARVEATGMVALGIPTGSHEIALADITPNCLISGSGARQVAVDAGGSVRLNFDVTCDLASPAGHGRELVFVRELDIPESGTRGTLHLMNDDGTGVRALIPQFQFRQSDPSWSPDGERLVFSANDFVIDDFDDLWILTSGSVSPTRLELADVLDAVEPGWSPVGNRIVFTHQDPTESDFVIPSEIMVVDTDGLNIELLDVDVPDLPGSPAWSPDATRLAVVSTPFVLTEDGECCDDGPSTLYVVDADGGNGRILVPTADSAAHPAWSPDGSTIAYSSHGDLFIVPAQGGTGARLTDHPGTEIEPAWSPDGSRIAFTSDRDGNNEIYVIDITGENLTRLTNDPADDSEPDWRP